MRDMFERVLIYVLIPALLWLGVPQLSWQTKPEHNAQPVPPSLEQATLKIFRAVLLGTTSQENSLMTFTRDAPDQVAPGEVFTVTDTVQAKVQLDFVAIVATLPEGFVLESGDLRKFQIGGLQAGEVLINSYEVKATSQLGAYLLSADARGKPQGGESQGLTVVLDLEVTDQAPPPPPPPPPPTNQRPIASFTFLPANPEVGDIVTFDASGSTDPDGTIANYRWNLGDGTVLEGPDQAIITYAYGSAGTFQVTLVVEDDEGEASLPKSALITVEAPPPPSLFGLPLEAVIAIGAVVAGIVVYLLFRALRSSSEAQPPSDEGPLAPDAATIAAQTAVERFLLLTDLPLEEVSSVKDVQKIDEFNRAQWVRTLVNRSWIIVAQDEVTLTVKAYEDLSDDEHAQLDLSPLGVKSLREFVVERVAEGDSIVSITWVAKDGTAFESLAVVDPAGQLKFDTFMSLVPVALTVKN